MVQTSAEISFQELVLSEILGPYTYLFDGLYFNFKK